MPPALALLWRGQKQRPGPRDGPKAGVFISRRSPWPDCSRSPLAWRQPTHQAAGPLLTLQVLSSPGQEIVEDVEGPLILGLADSTRFLQEIFANIEELREPEGRPPSTFLYSHQKPLSFPRRQEWHKTTN